jgi:hypothetical protein
MVFNKKCRMISFRLTADEYTEALNRCQQNGYRSVSTLARTATLGVVPTSAVSEGQEIRVIAEMQAKMSEMRTDLDLVLTVFAGKSEPVHLRHSHDDLGVAKNMN